MSHDRKIYVGQTLLTLKLYAGDSLAGQTSTVIHYKKPDDSTGTFTPTTVHDQLAKGRVDWQPTAVSDLDQPGEWDFWFKSTINGKDIYSDVDTITIYDPGQ